MKTIANGLLGIILILNSAFLFASSATFNTRIAPTGGDSWPVPPAVPSADNWRDVDFWDGGSHPPIEGNALNQDVVNIGRAISPHPAHYVLRIGDIGDNRGTDFTINVFPNSTLRVDGNIAVNTHFEINVWEGGTSIINGNLNFHTQGRLIIDGNAVVTGNITSHNSTLAGSGVLYVSGTTAGLINLATTNVTIVRDGNSTDLSLRAPVLSANVIAGTNGPSVVLNWQHAPQIISGFEFAGYQVFRDWAGQAQAQPPFDNIISGSGFLSGHTFTDNFSNTQLTLADAPVYYVRAVYQSISTPTQFRFSPISNKVDQFANIVTLDAPDLTGAQLPGTTVSVGLSWDFDAPVIANYTFDRYELFKDGILIDTTLAITVDSFIDTNLEAGDKPIYAIRAVYRNTPGTLAVQSSTEMYTPFSAPVDFSGSPLPIELLHFSAIAGEAGVSLKWSTATEINNDYFTIQRSIDGLNWEIINYMQGAGNSNRVISYEWDDKNPIQGISYYRLKQTDFDGQYEYFAPVAVEFNPVVTKTEILHVNGFGQQLNITLSNPAGPAHLLISDLQGRLIHREVVEGLEFIQQVSINLPHSFPGNIVVIRLAGQQNTDERKIRVN